MLRVCNTEGEYGDTVRKSFVDTHYVPVQKRHFDTIEISINTEDGKRLVPACMNNTMPINKSIVLTLDASVFWLSQTERTRSGFADHDTAEMPTNHKLLQRTSVDTANLAAHGLPFVICLSTIFVYIFFIRQMQQSLYRQLNACTVLEKSDAFERSGMRFYHRISCIQLCER